MYAIRSYYVHSFVPVDIKLDDFAAAHGTVAVEIVVHVIPGRLDELIDRELSLEELFWMIEEDKVSLFAQELKPAIRNNFV